MNALDELEEIKDIVVLFKTRNTIYMGGEKSETFNHKNTIGNEFKGVFEIVEKSLKALEVLKKLFNPEKYNFLELYENPFITIGVKGEKYRIDSTDDSYIHIGIPKEEFDLLKEVLE